MDMIKRAGTMLLGLWFTTAASAQITPLLFENFNNGFPAGWQLLNEDGLIPHSSVSYIDDAWVVVDAYDSTGIGDSILVATSYYVPAGTASDWVFLPPVTLMGNGNVLQWQVKSQDPSYPDGYQVLINTSAAVKDSFDIGEPAFTTDFELPVWTTRSIELDSFAGQTVYIAFRLKTTDHFLLLLDDIYIYSDSTMAVTEFTPRKPLGREYPNPNNGMYQVEYFYEDNAVYELFDMSGRNVFRSALKKGNNIMDVQMLEAGMYVSSITSVKGKQTNRIILR